MRGVVAGGREGGGRVGRSGGGGDEVLEVEGREVRGVCGEEESVGDGFG